MLVVPLQDNSLQDVLRYSRRAVRSMNFHHNTCIYEHKVGNMIRGRSGYGSRISWVLDLYKKVLDTIYHIVRMWAANLDRTWKSFDVWDLFLGYSNYTYF